MNFWQEKIKIGDIHIPRFIAGPLASFTDSPFRNIVRIFSPDELLYSEITHGNSLLYTKHTRTNLSISSCENPLNFQITTNSTVGLDVLCQRIQQAGVTMVDLNIGCPARNVVGSGSGSALMADVPKLQEIIKLLKSNLQIPLTVKMRAGFKATNAPEVSKLMEDEGINAIVIHPRLQNQKFKGTPQYDLVKKIKDSISIPVIISGNVTDFASAKNIYEQTGVDGFMVSRAMRGAPWKLKEMKLHSQGKQFNLSIQTIKETALAHLEQMLDYYGTHGLYMFRKHLAFYIKHGPDAARYREHLIIEDSVEKVKAGLNEFFGIYGG